MVLASPEEAPDLTVPLGLSEEKLRHMQTRIKQLQQLVKKERSQKRRAEAEVTRLKIREGDQGSRVGEEENYSMVEISHANATSSTQHHAVLSKESSASSSSSSAASSNANAAAEVLRKNKARAGQGKDREVGQELGLRDADVEDPGAPPNQGASEQEGAALGSVAGTGPSSRSSRDRQRLLVQQQPGSKLLLDVVRTDDGAFVARYDKEFQVVFDQKQMNGVARGGGDKLGKHGSTTRPSQSDLDVPSAEEAARAQVELWRTMARDDKPGENLVDFGAPVVLRTAQKTDPASPSDLPEGAETTRLHPGDPRRGGDGLDAPPIVPAATGSSKTSAVASTGPFFENEQQPPGGTMERFNNKQNFEHGETGATPPRLLGATGGAGAGNYTVASGGTHSSSKEPSLLGRSGKVEGGQAITTPSPPGGTRSSPSGGARPDDPGREEANFKPGTSSSKSQLEPGRHDLQSKSSSTPGTTSRSEPEQPHDQSADAKMPAQSRRQELFAEKMRQLVVPTAPSALTSFRDFVQNYRKKEQDLLYQRKDLYQRANEDFFAEGRGPGPRVRPPANYLGHAASSSSSWWTTRGGIINEDFLVQQFANTDFLAQTFTKQNWKRHKVWRGAFVEERLLLLSDFFLGRNFFKSSSSSRDLYNQVRRRGQEESQPTENSHSASGAPSTSEPTGGTSGARAAAGAGGGLLTSSAVGADAQPQLEAEMMQRPKKSVNFRLLAYEFMLFFVDVYNASPSGSVDQPICSVENLVWKLRLQNRLTASESSCVADWTLGRGEMGGSAYASPGGRRTAQLDAGTAFLVHLSERLLRQCVEIEHLVRRRSATTRRLRGACLAKDNFSQLKGRRRGRGGRRGSGEPPSSVSRKIWKNGAGGTSRPHGDENDYDFHLPSRRAGRPRRPSPVTEEEKTRQKGFAAWVTRTLLVLEDCFEHAAVRAATESIHRANHERSTVVSQGDVVRVEHEEAAAREVKQEPLASSAAERVDHAERVNQHDGEHLRLEEVEHACAQLGLTLVQNLLERVAIGADEFIVRRPPADVRNSYATSEEANHIPRKEDATTRRFSTSQVNSALHRWYYHQHKWQLEKNHLRSRNTREVNGAPESREVLDCRNFSSAAAPLAAACAELTRITKSISVWHLISLVQEILQQVVGEQQEGLRIFQKIEQEEEGDRNRDKYPERQINFSQAAGGGFSSCPAGSKNGGNNDLPFFHLGTRFFLKLLPHFWETTAQVNTFSDDLDLLDTSYSDDGAATAEEDDEYVDLARSILWVTASVSPSSVLSRGGLEVSASNKNASAVDRSYSCFLLTAETHGLLALSARFKKLFFDVEYNARNYASVFHHVLEDPEGQAQLDAPSRSALVDDGGDEELSSSGAERGSSSSASEDEQAGSSSEADEPSRATLSKHHAASSSARTRGKKRGVAALHGALAVPRSAPDKGRGRRGYTDPDEQDHYRSGSFAATKGAGLLDTIGLQNTWRGFLRFETLLQRAAKSLWAGTSSSFNMIFNDEPGIMSSLHDHAEHEEHQQGDEVDAPAGRAELSSFPVGPTRSLESGIHFLSRTGKNLASSTKQAFFGANEQEAGHTLAEDTDKNTEMLNHNFSPSDYTANHNSSSSPDDAKSSRPPGAARAPLYQKRGHQREAEADSFGPRQRTQADVANKRAGKEQQDEGARPLWTLSPFHETAYRALLTIDLRDMLTLCLKDYRRFVDSEGMTVLVQLFASVSERCCIRSDALPELLFEGEADQPTKMLKSATSQKKQRGTNQVMEQDDGFFSSRTARRGGDRSRTLKQEQSLGALSRRNLHEAGPSYDFDAGRAGGTTTTTPVTTSRGTTKTAHQRRRHFYCYLVWSAGTAQCERLLRPMKLWESKSAKDIGLFQQMLSVQKFMDELAENIEALKEEIACDDEYYSQALDLLFLDPAVGKQPRSGATSGRPDSQRPAASSSRRWSKRANPKNYRFDQNTRRDHHGRAGRAIPVESSTSSSTNASEEEPSIYFSHYSVHIIVDAIRYAVRDVLYWVAGEKRHSVSLPPPTDRNLNAEPGGPSLAGGISAGGGGADHIYFNASTAPAAVTSAYHSPSLPSAGEGSAWASATPNLEHLHHAATGGGSFPFSTSRPNMTRPWNVASEEELPPSGGKVVWAVYELEQEALPWTTGSAAAGALTLPRDDENAADYYINRDSTAVRVGGPGPPALADQHASGKTIKSKTLYYGFYTHFPESLNAILEPLVNVAIVSRFQQFHHVIISKCLAPREIRFTPMRPPALLHTTAVLDMWNFVFSAFDAVVSFRIPIQMCVLPVFCNFLQKTLNQFADLCLQFDGKAAAGSGATSKGTTSIELGSPEQIFPLLAKAKKTFAEVRLPDNAGYFSDGNSTSSDEQEPYNSGRGEIGANYASSPEPRGAPAAGRASVSPQPQSTTRLSWLRRRGSKPGRTAAGGGAAVPVSAASTTGTAAARQPSRYRFSFARRKANDVMNPSSALLQPLVAQAQVATPEKQLPAMTEIVVRVRSLAFCAQQLLLLRDHVCEHLWGTQDGRGGSGPSVEQGGELRGQPREGAALRREEDRRSSYHGQEEQMSRGAAGRAATSLDQKQKAQEMLETALLRCRQATLLPAVERLIGYVCGHMVHLELGKALWVSLYTTTRTTAGGRSTAAAAQLAPPSTTAHAFHPRNRNQLRENASDSEDSGGVEPAGGAGSSASQPRLVGAENLHDGPPEAEQQAVSLEALFEHKWRPAIENFFDQLGILNGFDVLAQQEHEDSIGGNSSSPSKRRNKNAASSSSTKTFASTSEPDRDLSSLALTEHFLPVLFQAWGYVVVHLMRQGKLDDFLKRVIDGDADFLINLAREYSQGTSGQLFKKASNAALDEAVATAQRLQILLNSGVSTEDLKSLAWQFGAEQPASGNAAASRPGAGDQEPQPLAEPGKQHLTFEQAGDQLNIQPHNQLARTTTATGTTAGSGYHDQMSPRPGDHFYRGPQNPRVLEVTTTTTSSAGPRSDSTRLRGPSAPGTTTTKLLWDQENDQAQQRGRTGLVSSDPHSRSPQQPQTSDLSVPVANQKSQRSATPSYRSGFFNMRGSQKRAQSADVVVPPGGAGPAAAKLNRDEVGPADASSIPSRSSLLNAENRSSTLAGMTPGRYESHEQQQSMVPNAANSSLGASADRAGVGDPAREPPPKSKFRGFNMPRTNFFQKKK
ncbi:unnamed protein product [Amoebophrya sp. A120]|nr:unnamed protein product [Amoebophrya sp. A120]|eukprot:GSA120T00005994001.1